MESQKDSKLENAIETVGVRNNAKFRVWNCWVTIFHNGKKFVSNGATRLAMC